MTVRDDLLAAYMRIADRERWCKARYFNYADQADLVGALIDVGLKKGPPYDDAPRRAADAASYALFSLPPAVVNDRYGHRAALMVLRHAILREEGLA